MNLQIKVTTVLILVGILFLEAKTQETLFPNSVVSNDIDFILDTDADVFSNLEFIGREDKEMPSSISNELFDENTFVFRAQFSDGGSTDIWCHSSFLTQDKATEYAAKLCPRLGKLPSIQRNMLDHVVIHNGDAGAFAEIEGQFFILYSDNMDDRISTNDLEETVFHESVHASFQFMYQNDITWTSAQAADPKFVTDYAQDNPQLEDMAESALFAYTLLVHPGRLDNDIEIWLKENIPNRIEFFRSIYQISTSLDDSNASLPIKIYPNPTRNKITIRIEKIDKSNIAKIYNISGQFMKSIHLNNGDIPIDISHLPRGIYYISLLNEAPLKFIKY